MAQKNKRTMGEQPGPREFMQQKCTQADAVL